MAESVKIQEIRSMIEPDETISASTQTPTLITIHCSDTPDGQVYPRSEMRREHLKRGFDDVGYHFLIQPDGAIEEGRPINNIGAHVKNANLGNIGICLIGRRRFTRNAFSTLKKLLDELHLRWNIPGEKIFCHREFKSAIEQKKTCPNMRPATLIYWYCTEDEKALTHYTYFPQGEDSGGHGFLGNHGREKEVEPL